MRLLGHVTLFSCNLITTVQLDPMIENTSSHLSYKDVILMRNVPYIYIYKVNWCSSRMIEEKGNNVTHLLKFRELGHQVFRYRPINDIKVFNDPLLISTLRQHTMSRMSASTMGHLSW